MEQSETHTAKRKTSKTAIYCMIPTVTFWKMQKCGDSKKSSDCPGVRMRQDEQMRGQDFDSSEAILDHTVMMDTCHYICQNLYNAEHQEWTRVNDVLWMMVSQAGSPVITNTPLWRGTTDNIGGSTWPGPAGVEWAHGNSLYFCSILLWV